MFANANRQAFHAVSIRGNKVAKGKEASPQGKGKTPQPRSNDWETIERAYRAGLLSLREIAKHHGISDTAIRKKAKLLNWERDLTDRVNERARAELVRAEVRKADPRTEQEIIEESAATVVQVVRSHRKHITKQIELVTMLTEQLVDAAGNREDIEDDIYKDTTGKDDGRRRAAMLKAVSLPSHTGAIVNLTNALKSLIGMERQAFNIQDANGGEGETNVIGELLKQVSGTSLPVVKDEQPQ